MRISLFWRTFLLLAALLGATLLAVFGLARALDPAPPEQRAAWEVASVLNLTRSALISSQPGRRAELLGELARDEGVRVLPLEENDRVEPYLPPARAAALGRYLRALLGPETDIAGRINGEAGLWVSFAIDDAHFWLQMQQRRVERHFGPDLRLIIAIAAALSLVGAIVFSRLVNRPLALLSGAIDQLSQGDRPTPLREDLVSEIAAVNRRFNRMARDLVELESDRAVALAGISHDIRGPLARLRLEIELARLPDGVAEAMCADIERIDRIVGQFVDYARGGEIEEHVESIDLPAFLAALRSNYQAEIDAGTLDLSLDITPGIAWEGDPIELQRMLANLLENARRYGRDQSTGMTRVDVTVRAEGSGLLLEVRDHGKGVPSEAREHMLRPFARLDQARGDQEGSGLGLAIVARIARRHGGDVSLHEAQGGGLLVRVRLRRAS